jgi:small subunit ribosomal protein S12|tara:strand:- start:515 stop:919 length:405 start_codon:yes stop_codon:yes gene_type:complete
MVQIHSLQNLMSTFSQTIKMPKIKKLKRKNSPKLKNNPQKKAVCLRVLTISPKKPNSANRRVVKTSVTHYKTKLTAKIPGESHNLQQHSTILVRGSRVRDLIGVSYTAVRGKFDLQGVANRKTARSRFGVKKLK